MVEPFLTVAVLAVTFAFSGPVRWLWRHKTQTPPPAATA
jgi:hypothetical protein